MEKLPMCRICLVENVRMYAVVSKNMQDLYETLTDSPFVSEDTRPALACFFCYAKLKQCCQLQRQCRKAEELFAQMMHEPNASINRGQLELFNGFVKSHVVNISIIGFGQMEHITIKEELPVYYEGPEDIIEPKEEHQSDDCNGYSDVEDRPRQHSESDIMEYKSEVGEEQEVLRKKRRATDTGWASDAKKPKEDTRRIELKEVIPAEQMWNELPETKIVQTTQSSTPVVIFNDPYKCDKCQRRFRNKANLFKHIRTHTGETPYKCDICQRYFTRQSLLTNHIRTHTGERPYKCDICQRTFSVQISLTLHIRTHTGEKPYKCEVCQRGFGRKGDLDRHRFTHTGEKPYNCHICQRSFNQKSNLLQHVLTHTGKKQYKCDICHRSCSSKSCLKLHIRTHTGEKPFKCHICKRGFGRKGDLERHIPTHTGEKPYKCDICQRSFSLKSNLVKHIRTHTGK